MVPGKDLRSWAVVVVEQYEVLEQVEQALLLADAHQHGLKGDAAGVGLAQALPLMEELIGTAKGSNLGFKTVGEHDHRVVVEDLRDCILVVGVVVAVCHIYVLVMALELHEQERHAVHESH